MLANPGLEPIDYLIIGHLTKDLTVEGPRLGGTAGYAALTAQALGMRVGVVTSWGQELPLGRLETVPIVNLPVEQSTTFENLYTELGREQVLHQRAAELDLHLVPETWRSAPLVHLGPVAQEVSSTLVRHFPQALLCLTPQGWLREWDTRGGVRNGEWPEATYVLSQVDAAVLSEEDLGGDEARIAEMAAACPILAVTVGADGVCLYIQGELHCIEAPLMEEIDSTGAGDIFAAAFFMRLHTTKDPVQAARFANHLAARSVASKGLQSAPTREAVYQLFTEVN